MPKSELQVLKYALDRANQDISDNLREIICEIIEWNKTDELPVDCKIAKIASLLTGVSASYERRIRHVEAVAMEMCMNFFLDQKHTVDLNEVFLSDIFGAYEQRFAPLPEAMMSNDIVSHVCDIIKNVPDPEALTIDDYKEVMEDHRRLVRELDVILNGEGAAKQASLCDIVAQLAHERKTQ